MFKVLIVDDEPIVRNGLASIIDWESHGFNVCGLAANGIEGMKLIHVHHPHLLLVDIKMPELDGMGMIQQLQEEGIQIHIIILTGHSQFEYARKAVNFNVDAYLLKPIDEEELIAYVRKMHQSLQREESLRINRSNSLKKLSQMILGDIVEGRINQKTIDFLNLHHRLSLPWEMYQVVLLIPALPFSPGNPLEDIVARSIHEWASGWLETVFFRHNIHLVMLCGSVQHTGRTCTRADLETLKACLEISTEQSLSLIVGPQVDNADRIHHSYRCASERTGLCFHFGPSAIIDDEKETLIQESGQTNTCELFNQLCTALQVQENGAVEQCLGDVNRRIFGISSNPEVIRTNYASLYSNLMQQFAADYPEIGGSLTLNHDVLADMYTSSYFEKLHQLFSCEMRKLASRIQNVQPAGRVNQILEYVNRNYTRDLKLESLSMVFHYNTSYLGKLFKSSCGVPFNAHLEKLRMEKAKELLREGRRVYEVAEMAGFNNIDYFQTRFKKYTGLSPAQYRDGNH